MNVTIQHIKDPRRRRARTRLNLRFKSTTLAYAQGVVHGKRVKNRVMNQGRTVQRAPGYSTGNPGAASERTNKSKAGRYWVVQDYADAAGISYRPEQVVRSGNESMGVVRFEDSSEAHSRTKRGTYKTSGGLWDGLGVQRTGRGRAKVAFFGRSLGRNPFESARARGKLAKGQRVAGIKVSNAKKAWAIFESHKVHVLSLFDRERDDLRGGRRYVLRRWADRVLGVAPQRESLGRLGREVVRRYGNG